MGTFGVAMESLRIFSVIALVASAISFSSVSAEKPVLKIATIHVPPLTFLDDQTGEATGSIVQTARSVANRCGISIEFIYTPAWGRSYEMAASGIADGIIPTTYIDERLEHFDYAKHAYGNLFPSIIVRSNSEHNRLSGLDMMNGKRLAIRAKSIVNDALMEKINRGDIVPITRANTKSSLDALLSGEVEFMLASRDIVYFYLGKKQTVEKVRILEPSLGHTPQYLALSKKRSPIFAENTAFSDCLLNAKP